MSSSFPLRRIDWALVAALLFLAAVSLATLFSVNRALFERQVLWYALFFAALFFCSTLNWRWLLQHSWFRWGVYGLGLALATAAHFQSGTVRGTKSWLVFGGFQFEPSELIKAGLIFVFAGFFSRRYRAAWAPRNILISFLYAFVPAAVVALHPDFGSAIVIMGLWVGFLFSSGFDWKRVGALFLSGAIVAALAWSFLLRPYQKDRIVSFLDPGRDPLGASYNVIQSKIAVGSAGLWGKGFQMGTQTHLKFLPEPETDFIFPAFVEEWGLAGGLLVLLTFLFIIFRITLTGSRARNNELRFIGFGTALVFLIHIFVNLGSALGFTPVTGISLPLLSYGGSNLLTLGVLLSIIQRINIES